jgi:hypothetical protein
MQGQRCRRAIHWSRSPGMAVPNLRHSNGTWRTHTSRLACTWDTNETITSDTSDARRSNAVLTCTPARPFAVSAALFTAAASVCCRACNRVNTTIARGKTRAEHQPSAQARLVTVLRRSVNRPHAPGATFVCKSRIDTGTRTRHSLLPQASARERARVCLSQSTRVRRRARARERKKERERC